MPPSDAAFAGGVAAVSGIPPSLAPWGRGWCAAVACILEASAPKPGNVHPAASFPDLTFADLVAAGLAIAGPIDAAPTRPLGATVRRAVEASRAATASNANLGIVLAIAPLAAVPTAPHPGGRIDAGAVRRLLDAIGPADAADVWRAIAIARPGGLGRSDRWDVDGPPPADLLAAMRHAADRDAIAALWAGGYADLVAGPVADLAAAVAAGLPLGEAIVRCHLRQLARRPDSLLVRRHGAALAADVSARAAAVVTLEGTAAWEAAVAELDRSLRQPRRLNPGTSADLVAAALYILLRDGSLRPALPFATASFPFRTSS